MVHENKIGSSYIWEFEWKKWCFGNDAKHLKFHITQAPVGSLEQKSKIKSSF